MASAKRESFGIEVEPVTPTAALDHQTRAVKIKGVPIAVIVPASSSVRGSVRNSED